MRKAAAAIAEHIFGWQISRAESQVSWLPVDSTCKCIQRGRLLVSLKIWKLKCASLQRGPQHQICARERAAQFILATFCQSSAGGTNSLALVAPLCGPSRRKAPKEKGREKLEVVTFEQIPRSSQPESKTHTAVANTHTKRDNRWKMLSARRSEREFSNKFIPPRGDVIYFFPVGIFFSCFFVLSASAHRFCRCAQLANKHITKRPRNAIIKKKRSALGKSFPDAGGGKAAIKYAEAHTRARQDENRFRKE